MRISLISLPLCCLLLAACASAPRMDAIATFIVVRHAEKAEGGGRDPDLSASGHARAQALARRLDGHDLVAVYASGYKRTHQTAQPSADAHGLDVASYDAAQPADALAAGLRAAHPRGDILIAGHSNTVPDIVAALCGCTVAPMPDDEYDRLSIVRIDAGGHARLDTERYGAASPVP